jgi:hypothetical protein
MYIHMKGGKKREKIVRKKSFRVSGSQYRLRPIFFPYVGGGGSKKKHPQKEKKRV